MPSIKNCSKSNAGGSGESAPLLKPVFEGAQKVKFWCLAAVWLALVVFFWQWWLRPEHIASLPRYVVLTAVLVWLTLLPGYFIGVFSRALKPNVREVAGRVAMVVTKAPSEPINVVQKTLLAMLNQNFHTDFDVWLADEDPSEQTLAWCRKMGVFVSTRHGIEDYHRAEWPRRTRCKEGNLAYFYDTYGYDRYDFVAQLDADHVPEPDYLANVISPFADKRVGYVSAPSICDANADQSWSARGRLHVEASMHGALQAGYTNGLAPLCIGSHYAVRTEALKQIGGLGPELAEDHSTTLMMNAGGWNGVHATEAYAHGDGPITFTDLVTQEFQWSRSLATILLRYSPIYVPHLPLRKKTQFLFSQLWYPLFSLTMSAQFLLPIYALWIGEPIVSVTFYQFIIHFMPLSLWLIVMAFWWRGSGQFRPVDGKILGWESSLFLLARWPWSALGVACAVRDRLGDGFVDFRITPKGMKNDRALPFRVLVPYLVLALASGTAAVFLGTSSEVWGMRVFATINAIVYAMVLMAVVVLHLRETGLIPRVVTSSAPAIAASCVLLILPSVALSKHGLQGLQALQHGQDRIILTRQIFSPAGAGQQVHAQHVLAFSWNARRHKNVSTE